MKIVPDLPDIVPNITSNISIWQADFKVPGLPLHIVEEAVIKATGTNILSTWAKLNETYHHIILFNYEWRRRVLGYFDSDP